MKQKATKTQQHNATQREYYETRSDQQNWRMQPGTTSYIANHIDRFVKFAGLKKSDNILDVGCGMGKFTIPLANLGYQVEGLDLSPVLLKTLQARSEPSLKIPTHQADILCPPDTLNNRFEKTIGFFMLHHLIDVEASFKQIYSLLKQDGKLAFLDVNPLCFLYYLQITLAPSMSWKAEKGIFNLTSSKLRTSLKNAGFGNVKIERYGILPPPLRNTRFGPAMDNAFDKIGLFRPMSAFQLISADRIN